MTIIINFSNLLGGGQNHCWPPTENGGGAVTLVSTSSGPHAVMGLENRDAVNG